MAEASPTSTGLIFDWAKRTPDRTAIVYNGQRWSYRSFARSIAKARGSFVRRGCVSDGHALLAVNNVKDFWILSLALRSLGLTTMVVHALDQLGIPNVRYVVTSSGEDWPGLDDACARRGVDLHSVSLEGEPSLALDAFQSPHPPGGHIVQTSGTTGRFKLIATNDAFDAPYHRRKIELIGMNTDTVLCLFGISPSSAVGYRWAICAWAAGGCSVMDQGGAPYRALLHPGLTHAIANPAMLAIIVDAPPDAFPRHGTMHLTVTGGAMTRAQIDLIKARVTPHLYNQLASTEAGEIGFTRLDTAEDNRWNQPIPGRVFEIVDECDRPVPVGEVGRVRVSTADGPSSYLNDEKTTREFFRDGYFYPGDLALMRSDGRFALQGRVTDVINVRGRKIYPASIEGRLSDALGVSDVCLFSMQDGDGEENIHVVVETQRPLDEARVVSVLNQKLPGFPKVRMHQVADMPRNESGKILRQEVRARAVSGAPAVAPVET